MKKTVAVAIALALIAGWKFIVLPGYVYLAEQFEGYQIKHMLNVVYPSWNENLQAPNIVDNTKLYLYLIAILFSFGSYKLLQIILLLAPVSIAFLSMFRLARYFNRGKWGAYLSAFIYTINPWFATEPRNVVLRFEYALTPLLLYLFIRIIDERDLKSGALFAIILSIMGDIRYTFLMTIWFAVIILSYYFIKVVSIKDFLRGAVLVGFFMFVSGVLSLGRFIPSLIYTSRVSNVFAEAFTSSSVSRLPYFDVFTTQTLSGPELNFNMTYDLPLYYLFVVVVAFSLLGIRQRGMNRQRDYLIPLILLVFSVPFCVVHGITFVGIPTLGRLLRHAKWNTIPLVLAVSLLSGYSIERFERKKLVALAIVVITGISSYPLLTGDLNGYWRPSKVPRDYIEVNRLIENANGSVLWMPTFSSRKATWVRASTPYAVGAPTGVFDIRSSSVQSFDYSVYYFFLYYTPIYDFRFCPVRNFKDYRLLGKLYSMIGIKYLSIHNDIRWIGEDEIHGTSSEQIRRVEDALASSGYIREYNGTLVKLYGIPYPARRFSTTSLGVDIAGDRLMDLGTILSISNTSGITFWSFRRDTNPKNARFFIVKDDPTLDLMNWDAVVRPFSFTVNDIPEEGWVRSKVSSYDFLYYLWLYNITWNWYFDYDSGLVYTVRDSELGSVEGGEWKSLPLNFSPNSMFLTITRGDGYVSGHVLAGADNMWTEAISTPIKVRELSYYMIQMYLSGLSVVDLNPVVYYYDKNNRLLDFDVLNGPLNGTFSFRRISGVIRTPENADHIRISIRTWRNPRNDSEWILKNLTIMDLSNFTRYNTLKVKFNVDKDGLYTAFARVFYNEKGGAVSFIINGRESVVHTKDDVNEFRWVKLGRFYLKKGGHYVELKNIKGFNAVNLIVFVRDYEKKVEKVREFLRDKDLIYVYEAERDFHLRDGSRGENGIRVTYVSNEFIKPLYLGRPSSSWVFAPSVVNPQPVCYNSSCKISIEYTVGSPNGSRISVSTRGGLVYVDYSFENINATPVVVDWDLNDENWSPYDVVTLRVYGDGSGNLFELWYYDSCARKHVRIGGVRLSWEGWRTLTFPLPDVYRRGDVTHFRVVISWGRKREGLGNHELVVGGIELKRTRGFEMWRNFESFRGGLYNIAVRGSNGTFKVYVDGDACTLNFGRGFQWRTCVMNITPGEHIIRIVSPKVGSRIDAVVIYEGNRSLESLFDRKVDAQVLEYKKISTTKWRVKVRANSPFVLAFSYGYDPLWVAEVDGEEYHSIPLYGVINGFYIEKTGEYWITVEYKLQDYQRKGLMISAIGFVGVGLFLWLQWRGYRWEKKKP